MGKQINYWMDYDNFCWSHKRRLTWAVLLLEYFNKIYPIKDAYNGTFEPVFDVCFNGYNL